MSYLHKNIPTPIVVSENPGYFDDLEKAKANPEKVTHLNLQNYGLESVPKEIYAFKNMVTLDLSMNSLHSLPLEMKSQLPHLEELFLVKNQFTTIGNDIIQLTQLRILNVSENPILTIAPEINSMKKLSALKISSTDPNVKFQPSIWELNNLEHVFLLKLNISSISPEIKNWSILKELCLNDNKLESIPSELFNNPQIEYLGFGNNNIQTIPTIIFNYVNDERLRAF
jgi:Leucine-rich repeat (LRR) protein